MNGWSNVSSAIRWLIIIEHALRAHESIVRWQIVGRQNVSTRLIIVSYDPNVVVLQNRWLLATDQTIAADSCQLIVETTAVLVWRRDGNASPLCLLRADHAGQENETSIELMIDRIVVRMNLAHVAGQHKTAGVECYRTEANVKTLVAYDATGRGENPNGR